MRSRTILALLAAFGCGVLAGRGSARPPWPGTRPLPIPMPRCSMSASW